MPRSDAVSIRNTLSYKFNAAIPCEQPAPDRRLLPNFDAKSAENFRQSLARGENNTAIGRRIPVDKPIVQHLLCGAGNKAISKFGIKAPDFFAKLRKERGLFAFQPSLLIF